MENEKNQKLGMNSPTVAAFKTNARLFPAIYSIIRYLAPITIAFIFLTGIIA
jgi:hypothetical protein